MEFLSIQNFKYGLDTRRSVMTSTPGVLSKLENAHINAGSEIEKRKSFFRSAVGFPDTTFGLEATEEGLVTFGSTMSPGSLPGGVVYQQLQSPSSLDSEGNLDAMTGVVYSCNFNGKAFVLAQFNSGVYAFYDGVAVHSSYAGKVLYGSLASPGVADMTIDQMADAVVAEIETVEGWDAENMGGGVVEINSPPGVYFTAVSDVVSDDGSFSDITMVEQNDPGVSPVGATSRFIVINGVSGTPGTYALTAFSDVEGTETIALTTAPVTRAATSTLTAEAIVTAVNYYTAVTGYTAIQGTDGESVIIVAPPELGDIDFNLTVTTTEDDDTDITTEVGGLTATVDTTYLVKQYRNEFMHTHDVFSPWVHVLASEGSGGYEFDWQEFDYNGDPIDPADVTGVVPKYDDRAGTNFHKVMEINTEINAYFKCYVIDDTTGSGYTPLVHVLLSNMKV